jgi:dephospho-CoA kinase
VEYTELSKKYGIGLTGGIATGKSTVSKILRDLGYTVIDADQLARKAVELGSNGLAQVVDKFGAIILKSDGTLNRKKLGAIIFEDASKRKLLEDIVHPIIHDLLSRNLRDQGIIDSPRYWFYEASLLFETGAYAKFKEIWCTYCDKKEQLRRLTHRDQYTKAFAQTILASQMDGKEKAERSDVVINTDAPIEQLAPKVKDALERLKTGQSPFSSVLWSIHPRGRNT